MTKGVAGWRRVAVIGRGARHPDFGKGTNDGQLWGYSKSSCQWIRCPLEGACCTIGVRMGGLASRPGHLTKKSLDNDCDSIALQA